METALVLPLFLMAVLTVLMIGEMVRFSGNLQTSLAVTAKRLSMYAYAWEHAVSGVGGSAGTEGPGAGTGGESGGLSSAVIGKAVSVAAGRSMVLNDLGEAVIRSAPVEGGSGGISFLHSSLSGRDEIIDLAADYRMKLPFAFFGIDGFRVVDRARIRAFTGYDNTRREDLSEDEEIVFITKHGTVYHRMRDCRHLKLSIRETTREGVEKERNEDGGKYYACEYCGRHRGSVLYLTGDGDRYHTALSCPGLKRSILAVPLSQTNGRPPCKSCSM